MTFMSSISPAQRPYITCMPAYLSDVLMGNVGEWRLEQPGRVSSLGWAWFSEMLHSELLGALAVVRRRIGWNGVHSFYTCIDELGLCFGLTSSMVFTSMRGQITSSSFHISSVTFCIRSEYGASCSVNCFGNTQSSISVLDLAPGGGNLCRT